MRLIILLAIICVVAGWRACGLIPYGALQCKTEVCSIVNDVKIKEGTMFYINPIDKVTRVCGCDNNLFQFNPFTVECNMINNSTAQYEMTGTGRDDDYETPIMIIVFGAACIGCVFMCALIGAQMYNKARPVDNTNRV